MEVWRRTFWNSYWIALRRSPHDKRARIFALRVSALIVYLLAYIGYIVVLPFRAQDGGWLVAFYGFIFGTGLIAYYALRRSHQREQQMLTFSLVGAPTRPTSDSAQTSPATCAYLSRRAAILAALIGRAASEIGIAQGSPGGDARQLLNPWLRENQLWEHLEPPELSLMSAPAGSWTAEQRDSIVKWCEQLRLLRWIFGIDAELIAIEHFPRPDLKVTEGMQQVLSSSGTAQRTWDLRIQRDNAVAYHTRIVAEFMGRDMLPAGPDLASWADELRGQMTGASTDYLAGTKTIADLDEAALRLLWMTAFVRMQYADWLLEQLDLDTATSFTEWIEHRSESE